MCCNQDEDRASRVNVGTREFWGCLLFVASQREEQQRDLDHPPSSSRTHSTHTPESREVLLPFFSSTHYIQAHHLWAHVELSCAGLLSRLRPRPRLPGATPRVARVHSVVVSTSYYYCTKHNGLAWQLLRCRLNRPLARRAQVHHRRPWHHHRLHQASVHQVCCHPSSLHSSHRPSQVCHYRPWHHPHYL